MPKILTMMTLSYGRLPKRGVRNACLGDRRDIIDGSGIGIAISEKRSHSRNLLCATARVQHQISSGESPIDTYRDRDS